MSYNPARSTKDAKLRRRTVSPFAGVRHSELMRREGIGQHSPVNKERRDTKHGFAKDIFVGTSFVQRYECMYAGNNTGIGVNKTGDRTVLVQRGNIFVALVDEKGAVNMSGAGEGTYLTFAAGTCYGLATPGTSDAELLIVESPDYVAGWEQLKEATISPVNDQTLLVSPKEVTFTRRSLDQSVAKSQAETMAVSKAKRAVNKSDAKAKRAEISNVNSSTIIGVNPKAVIPTDDD